MSNNYHNFVKALQNKLSEMATTGLFEVSLDKDVVWNTYLDSFPAGTNNLFRERREYDCNCCKQFIRDVGRVVTFVNGEKVSIWDIAVEGYYQPVVNELSALIHSAPVENEFLHFQAKVGTAQSNVLEGEEVVVYNHFHAVLPKAFVQPNARIATLLNDSRGNVQVLERSLKEFKIDAAETILELNAQGSLYRGNEQVNAVSTFISLKREYDKLSPEQKEGFIWTKGKELGAFGKFRNTAIGTLLEDLSGGMDIESAVKRWEKVMAPTNYKRPTALVTESMIKKAQETVEQLGLIDSLPRRYATLADIAIPNVLFADRNAKKSMNSLSELLSDAKKPVKGPSHVEEVSIEKFIRDVLPTATSIEALVENRMTGNLVSLVAPEYPDAPNMLRWKNNFSWSYNGDVTDSIKERVKTAGGNVDGPLRVSLAWHNADDLDLHMRTPTGDHIYFGNKRTYNSGAFLDLDMNGMDKHDEFNPVENIIFSNEANIREGEYEVWVNQWSRRCGDRVGFAVELDYKGNQFVFDHPKEHRDGDVHVVRFMYTREKGVEILSSIGHSKQSKEVWGVTTEQYQKVSVVMNSPNHWDGEQTGNKHYFFMLEGAVNPEGTRGFYNEYLMPSLAKEHGKVFEHLAGKMKVAPSDQQLSGIGFSDTKRDELIVKVTGNFVRTLKVIF